MSGKILIIEDERTIVDILCFNLEKEGYETLVAYDGISGLDMALTAAPDLILLDLMLPKMNGFDVCRSIRENGFDTPVIMVTAREGEDDKVNGLELGADDYITKPFSMRELLARIKANTRKISHSSSTRTAQVLTCSDVTLDTGSFEVRRNGELLVLTSKEYDLLKYLMSEPNRVISREELLEKVWNYDYYGDMRTVDVTIRRLREKIEDVPANPTKIVTKRGVGYFFKV